MLLRASGQHTGESYDLNAVLGKDAGESGIPGADVLIELAEAILPARDKDDARLAAARQAVHDAMGADALSDAAAVAALFNAIDRVADSCGIGLEDEKAEMSAEFRAQLGIDNFGVQPGSEAAE